MVKALQRLKHTLLAKLVHSPTKFVPLVHGTKTQYVEPYLKDVSLLSATKIFVQQVARTFLYYSQTIDNTILVTIRDLGHQQASPTTSTIDIINYFLDYVATYPIMKLRYYKSKIVLHINSDRSYLSVNKSKSQAGGYYFLSSNDSDPSKATKNGAIHVLCKILQNVMALAAETEIASAFENAKEAIPMQNPLVFLDHPQPPTPLQVDNTTAVNFANNELKQKWSKAVDMQFYWL